METTTLEKLTNRVVYKGSLENLDPKQRAVILKETNQNATEDLEVVCRNAKEYSQSAQQIVDFAASGLITERDAKDSMTILREMHSFIEMQMEKIKERYSVFDYHFKFMSYITISLQSIDELNGLGIYDCETAIYHPDNLEKILEDFLKTPLTQEQKKKRDTLIMDFLKKEQEAFEAIIEADGDFVFLEKKEAEQQIKKRKQNFQFDFVTSDVTFKDVAGQDELKEDLKQLVDMIQNPDKYRKYGAKTPKGVLLYGPPGTGKTLISRAIAGESKVKFIALSGTDFTSSTWGVVPKMTKALFETAKKNAPCIIFIDEIDMLGADRGADKANSLPHKEALESFLHELDGFNRFEGVTVIGATNRLNDLDPAFKRPGRFDGLYAVPIPTSVTDVEKIVMLYTKNKRIDKELHIREIAKKMLGNSPASIESIINDACLLAIRDNKGVITKRHLDEARLKKSINGHFKKVRNTDPAELEKEQERREKTAYHEAGHAIVALAFGIPLQTVTVVETTTGAGGLTTLTPSTKCYYTQGDYEKQIRICYGGRAAESLCFGEKSVTTGACADIKQATFLLENAFKNYGFAMGSKICAPIAYEKMPIKEKEMSAAKYYEETIIVLKKHIIALKNLAHALMEEGTISGSDAKKIFNEAQEMAKNISIKEIDKDKAEIDMRFEMML